MYFFGAFGAAHPDSSIIGKATGKSEEGTGAFCITGMKSFLSVHQNKDAVFI
jgi:hypothetical protein